MTLNGAGPATLVLLGLVLGMKHATDADHVIAVTTIVSRERRIARAAMVGAVWGIGHTMTVLIVGGAIVLFKLAVPIRIAAAMEFAVAIVLVLLGVSTLWSIARDRAAARGSGSSSDGPLVHSHAHSHGDIMHSHPHAHLDGEDAHDHVAAVASAKPARSPLWRPLGVGVVHGLAGSAAIALLVLSAIPDPLWAIVYLMVFGSGTVLGMVAITTAIGLPIAFTASRLGRLNRTLAATAGLVSLGFGLFLAFQIGAPYVE